MALRLILVRHAKSSWKQRNGVDHERPLNKRGRASAAAIGAWLRKKGYLPDLVQSSTAHRTRETHDLMGVEGTVDFDKTLYLASAETMLGKLQTATGNTVLMLGHNPGTAELAERLAAKLPAHDRFLDYPTAATTVFEFDVDSWDKVAFGTGKIRAFVIPADLT